MFDVSRRRVATFETAVRKGDNKQGFIDLLWKGVILVEHKSRGRDLDKAFQQAKDYFPGLKEHEYLLDDLGKFKMAKACIYIKKLSDINILTLEKICKSTIENLKQNHNCVC